MKALKVQNLTYFYDSRRCDGVDKTTFTLEPGELCAIVGPSGSGKTTLLKLIGNILTPATGTISVSDQLTRQIYTPHEETRGMENLTLGQFLSHTQETENQARDLVSFLELSDDFNSPLSSLSTGQWHRAQLAKFFMQEKEILLLDEPFIHLDPDRRQKIAANILKLAKDQNKIVLWTTHFLEDSLRLSDKILVLNYGIQQQFGPPEEIYWNPCNLFVASFFSPNNLIIATATKTQPNLKTSIGDIIWSNRQDHWEGEKALMCRAHLCKIHSAPNKNSHSTFWKMKLEEKSFVGHAMRLKFSSQLREWWVDVATQPGTQLTLELLHEYWIEIPETAWVVLLEL